MSLQFSQKSISNLVRSNQYLDAAQHKVVKKTVGGGANRLLLRGMR